MSKKFKPAPRQPRINGPSRVALRRREAKNAAGNTKNRQPSRARAGAGTLSGVSDLPSASQSLSSSNKQPIRAHGALSNRKGLHA